MSFIGNEKTVLIFAFGKLRNKITNLVSDLFILLSVHPVWGEDGVGLPYQYDGDACRKIRI